MRSLALASLGSVTLLLASCGPPCDRSSPIWVPGEIVVTFQKSVTTLEQARAIVESMGCSLKSSYPVPPFFAVVAVPPGQECEAERRLLAHPEVSSALQNTYVSDR